MAASKVRYMFCGYANSVKMIVIALEFKPKYEENMRLPELTVAQNRNMLTGYSSAATRGRFLSLTLLLLCFPRNEGEGLHLCITDPQHPCTNSQIYRCVENPSQD
jgi:hypothetical protein